MNKTTTEDTGLNGQKNSMVLYISKLRAKFIAETGKDPTVLFIHGDGARQLRQELDEVRGEFHIPGSTPTHFQNMTVFSGDLYGEVIALGFSYPPLQSSDPPMPVSIKEKEDNINKERKVE